MCPFSLLHHLHKGVLPMRESILHFKGEARSRGGEVLAAVPPSHRFPIRRHAPHIRPALQLSAMRVFSDFAGSDIPFFCTAADACLLTLKTIARWVPASREHLRRFFDQTPQHTAQPLCC
jgi:hypothetical protein